MANSYDFQCALDVFLRHITGEELRDLLQSGISVDAKHEIIQHPDFSSWHIDMIIGQGINIDNCCSSLCKSSALQSHHIDSFVGNHMGYWDEDREALLDHHLAEEHTIDIIINSDSDEYTPSWWIAAMKSRHCTAKQARVALGHQDEIVRKWAQEKINDHKQKMVENFVD